MISREHLPLDQVLLRLVRSRLFLPLLAVSLSALVVSAFLGAGILADQQQQNVGLRAVMVDRYLDHASRMLDAVAQVADVSTPEDTGTAMQGMLGAYRYFDTLYLIDNTSRIVTMVPPDVRYQGLDVSGLPSYRQVSQQTGYRISRPFISLRTGNPTVYIIRDLPSGGAVAGELSLKALQQEISTAPGTGGEDFVFILDQYGTLIATRYRTWSGSRRTRVISRSSGRARMGMQRLSTRITARWFSGARPLSAGPAGSWSIRFPSFPLSAPTPSSSA